MLDKMYELNLVYFKELTMYILAGKKEAGARCANTDLKAAQEKAQRIRPARGRPGRPGPGRPVRPL